MQSAHRGSERQSAKRLVQAKTSRRAQPRTSPFRGARTSPFLFTLCPPVPLPNGGRAGTGGRDFVYANCCHRLRRRRRPARRRHRRLRHRAVSVATTAAVAEPAAAAAAALAVAAFAVAPPRRAEVEKASPPATLVMSLAERPQLHGLMLIPRDVDACRAIVAEQTERIARMVNGF